MSSSLTIQDYSVKSFILFGDTIKYKDNLVKLGGKYNPNLRIEPNNINSKKRRGWIFSVNKLSEVETYVASIGQKEKNIEVRNPHKTNTLIGILKKYILNTYMSVKYSSLVTLMISILVFWKVWNLQ